MSSQYALLALWATAGLNFFVGGVIWIIQVRDSEADAGSAIGTNLMGFAILVAVLALAAQAIVGAIQENAKSK